MIYYASKNLMDSETQYSCMEKLALAIVIDVQKFRHYILLCTTTVLANQNPMYYILARQVLGGKYSRWIVILQEFDLKFSKATSKKSVFAKLMCDLPCASTESEPSDSLPDEFLFLISTTINPWYGYFLIYLQTQRFYATLSHDDRHHIHHHVKYYRRGIDSILRRCLTHEEVEHVLNDCHFGACGGHLSGLATAQKIY